MPKNDNKVSLLQILSKDEQNEIRAKPNFSNFGLQVNTPKN